jgi:hypothetical protein
VVPNDIIGQHAHELRLISAAHGRQLEGPKADERRCYPTHHRTRLELGIAAAMPDHTGAYLILSLRVL